MSEIKPCPFCGGVAVTYLVEEGYYTGCSSANTCEMRPSVTAYTWNECRAAWNTRASDAYASVQRERDELREMLGRLLNARALSSVRELVAGWNGEHRPDGPYIERHPSRLGARIETNCGRIYELDEIMQEARAFLARYEGGRQ